MVAVVIEERATDSWYVAHRREDCRDGVDARVYDLVVEHYDHIKMGGVTGYPQRLERCWAENKHRAGTGR